MIIKILNKPKKIAWTEWEFQWKVRKYKEEQNRAKELNNLSEGYTIKD